MPTYISSSTHSCSPPRRDHAGHHRFGLPNFVHRAPTNRKRACCPLNLRSERRYTPHTFEVYQQFCKVLLYSKSGSFFHTDKQYFDET